MRIQWISIDSWGGSWLTDELLINHAQRVYGVEVSVGTTLRKGFDLTVISNIHHIEDYIYKELQEPFVKIDHDYGFCTYYEAMCYLHDDCKCATNAEIFKDLNNRALLNFYMSPAQYKVHEKHLGEIPNVRFVQSQIDWKPLRILRLRTKKEKDLIVSPTVLGYHKGASNLIKWVHQHKKKVVVCGRTEFKEAKDAIESEPLLEHIGSLKYKETLELIAKAEAVVFLPEWVEPTGRVVMEGIFLGCKIYTNENLGLYSWVGKPEVLDLELQVLISRVAFWDEIFRKMENDGKQK
jgi:glycosyltransferase involved in cell wall biosynthesis